MIGHFDQPAGAGTDQGALRSDWQLVAAARAALDAHSALEATQDTEPNPHDNQDAWMRWQHEVHLPAHHTWQTTIDCLEVLLGETFPGREGSRWFAMCLRILTAEEQPAVERGGGREGRESAGVQPGARSTSPQAYTSTTPTQLLEE